MGARPVGRRGRRRHVHGRGSVDMKGGVVAALHALARCAPPARRCPATSSAGGPLRGGRRPRDVRRARARRPLRRLPDPRADRAADRLRARRRADVHRRRARPQRARRPAPGGRVGDRPLHPDPRRAARARARASTRARATRCWPTPRSPIRCSSAGCTPGAGQARCPRSCVFEGRLGVPVGESLDDARDGLERAVAAAAGDDRAAGEITWCGGQFAPGRDGRRRPLGALVRGAADAPSSAPAAADRRRLRRRHAPVPRRAIPCVLFGPQRDPAGARRRRARRDRRPAAVARVIVRVILRFGA